MRATSASAHDTCAGATLNPGGDCTIQVQFAPTALGSRSADARHPVERVASGPSAVAATPDFSVALSGTGAEPTNTVTNTVTTPGTTTTKTVTKTITKTCTITVKWRWVTVKVHGKKKREHKKFTTRSKGCKRPTRKAAKPRRKHRG